MASSGGTVELPDQLHLGLQHDAGAGLDLPATSWISSHTSSAAAPGPATMKFACFVETCAPPTCVPFSPASSINFAACSPGGFLNTLPQLGSASGWVRRRHDRASSISARIAPGSPGRSATVTPVTTESAGSDDRR